MSRNWRCENRGASASLRAGLTNRNERLNIEIFCHERDRETMECCKRDEQFITVHLVDHVIHPVQIHSRIPHSHSLPLSVPALVRFPSSLIIPKSWLPDLVCHRSDLQARNGNDRSARDEHRVRSTTDYNGSQQISASDNARCGGYYNKRDIVSAG